MKLAEANSLASLKTTSDSIGCYSTVQYSTRKKREKSMQEEAIPRLYISSKQMKLASYRARVNRLSAREKRRKYSSKSSLTSLKTFDSCNEQPYVLTQLAIAAGKQYDCVILSKTDSIGFLPQKFKNNGKMNILKAILLSLIHI